MLNLNVAGAQGTQGLQGNIGADGAQGSAGENGVQGVQGNQGGQGPQGYQGTQGHQGVQGTAVQGAQGSAGFQGNRGFQGESVTGLQGVQGNQGFQGQQGAQGSQGSMGAQGVLSGSPAIAAATGDYKAKLLVHFDGADGSTNYTDDSMNPSSVVVTSGTVQIKNTQSKFGGTSGYFNGTATNVLRVTNTNSKISLGTNTFTIEGWFYFNAQASTRSPAYHPLLCFATNGDSQGPILLQTSSNEIRWLHSGGGGAWTLDLTTTSAGITNGAWHHIAVTSDGTTIKIYVNGTLRGSQLTASVYTSSYLYIGHYPYFNGSTPMTFNGYIDEVRISDVVRYTANFTPSATAFETGVLGFPASVTGNMAMNDGFLYVCTDGAAGTWKKVSSSSV